MSWTYKHQKMRDTLRERYTKETGRSDFESSAFENWLKAIGVLE